MYTRVHAFSTRSSSRLCEGRDLRNDTANTEGCSVVIVMMAQDVPTQTYLLLWSKIDSLRSCSSYNLGSSAPSRCFGAVDKHVCAERDNRDKARRVVKGAGCANIPSLVKGYLRFSVRPSPVSAPKPDETGWPTYSGSEFQASHNPELHCYAMHIADPSMNRDGFFRTSGD